jgi:hypothetical protein
MRRRLWLSVNPRIDPRPTNAVSSVASSASIFGVIWVFSMNFAGSTGTSNDDKGGSSNGLVFWLSVLVLAVLFFFAGIWVGTVFSSHHSVEASAPAQRIGLPNTNNKVEKWVDGAPPVVQLASKLRGPEVIPRPDAVAQIPQVRNGDAPMRIVKESEIKDKLSKPFHVDGQSYMSAPNTLDHDSLFIGAWISLDASSDINDMRTVFSNKGTGCGAGSEQHGVSMYVNAWQTRDQKLYVEYGGPTSGCNKLDSGSYVLQPKVWYHVAAYFGDHVASLYINGEEIASSTNLEGHVVQTLKPMLIGQYDGNQFPFSGNINYFTVVHSAVDHTDQRLNVVRAIMDVNNAGTTTIQNLAALYPLTDSAQWKKNRNVAYNSVGKDHGKFIIPDVPVAKRVDGVSYNLVDGTSEEPITDEMRRESDERGRAHAKEIVEGMKHAWGGYRAHAFGADELKPISGMSQDNWGGIGMTLVDSLDTLFLMGMKDEFKEAVDWCKHSLTFSRAGSVSVFETTIRALGGLLSAYDLSGEHDLLLKAVDLGDLLLPAFNTGSGIPKAMVDFRTHQASNSWSGDGAILSELGTLQVEFRYLAVKSKNADYETKAMAPVQLMRRIHRGAGLFPIKISVRDGSFADSHITFGALGDSFYEYLLKVWLQGGKKETWLREMYDEAVDGVVSKLLDTSSPSGYLFMADLSGSRNKVRKMDHLVCFMPGTLALGAYNDPLGLDSSRAQRDLAVAKALMYTCRQMYHTMPTGISPEYVEFPQGRDISVPAGAPFYILRPETAESLFILNQLTGDPVYREWAYEIWTAIERRCKTKFGYGPIRDVRSASSGNDDRMESFFLAETMKYLYLSQVPEKLVDLSTHVFNTEAHPMKIFSADEHKPIGE